MGTKTTLDEVSKRRAMAIYGRNLSRAGQSVTM